MNHIGGRFKPMRKSCICVLALLMIAGILSLVYLEKSAAQAGGQPVAEQKKFVSKSKDFPLGTGTPSVECGECHQAIYREYAFGFGGDVAHKSPKEDLLSLPGKVLTAGPAHSVSGTRPEPTHGQDVKTGHSSCSVCHYPEPFDLPGSNKANVEQSKLPPQAKKALGITCAGCHLTPDGKIRGPYGSEAPHATVKEPRIKNSEMCAHCHSAGKRVVAKQFQTYLEWQDDFQKAGLGSQQCQDCHMSRTLRKSAEDEDVPVRAVARHLWTGGHSPQGISNPLSVAIVAEKESTSALRFHLVNIGAGHSVPTGSNRRAIFLKADVIDDKGTVVAQRDWMFAPWYSDRPDDKAFLGEDKKRPNAALATKADEQGPHETIVRAGDERILAWDPKLKSGEYELRASLVYDLNRYNDPNFQGDQTTIFRKTLPFKVKE